MVARSRGNHDPTHIYHHLTVARSSGVHDPTHIHQQRLMVARSSGDRANPMARRYSSPNGLRSISATIHGRALMVVHWGMDVEEGGGLKTGGGRC